MAAQYTEFKSEGVWQHFLREAHGQSAKCKLCSTVLKTVGGSTKGLHEHLKRVHNMSVLKRKAVDVTADTAESSSSQLSAASAPVQSSRITGPLNKYMQRENTLQSTIAHMTACDGLAFKTFVTSPDLGKCLMARGFGNLPTSSETVKRMVMDKGRSVRSVVTNELTRKKREGQRFSLTLDEWTSGRNRRYMNINVHEKGGAFWSLGLIRVNGSMPAAKCVSLIEEKLSEFGLSLAADIVCIVTDGASVMVKVGNLIETEQQVCYAHAVQLAVLDVLYRRRDAQATPAPAVAATSVAAVNDSECQEDHSDSKEDGDVDAGVADARMEVVDDDYNVLMEMSPEYHAVVQKV